MAQARKQHIAADLSTNRDTGPMAANGTSTACALRAFTPLSPDKRVVSPCVVSVEGESMVAFNRRSPERTCARDCENFSNRKPPCRGRRAPRRTGSTPRNAPRWRPQRHDFSAVLGSIRVRRPGRAQSLWAAGSANSARRSAASACEGSAAQSAPATILPGFMMPCGSNARLIARIAASAGSPCSAAR